MIEEEVIRRAAMIAAERLRDGGWSPDDNCDPITGDNPTTALGAIIYAMDLTPGLGPQDRIGLHFELLRRACMIVFGKQAGRDGRPRPETYRRADFYEWEKAPTRTQTHMVKLFERVASGIGA